MADKKVLISETGWPSASPAKGQCVPSPANQATAIASIRKAFTTRCFLFEAFNDYWKPAGVEQHWGFLGDSPSTHSNRSMRFETRSNFTESW